MYIILHLAISQDGFIAKTDGDSNWVSSSDEELFKLRAKDAGCVIIGRKTFDQYQKIIYPIGGVLNIVLTTKPNEINTAENVTTATSPEEAISIAEKRGLSKILIAGGAQVSQTFLDKGMVNEIFLSVHQLKLGTGIKPFEDISQDKRYKLVQEKQLEDGVRELHYMMI
ncbi:MAG TPA: dihydrofolate reductase family protein [Candidatus Paceibacterota bacterium]